MRYWPQKPCLGTQINWGDPLARGLVGCWLMNEDSGNKVYDLSGNGNTGSLIADTKFVVGKFGPALNLDGTGDYIQCSHVNAIVKTRDYSIAVWIRFPALNYQTFICSQYNSATDFFGLQSDGSYRIVLQHYQGTSYYAVGTPPVTAQRWYHVAAIAKADTSKIIYLNGIAYAGAGTAHNSGSGSNFVIGATSDGLDHFAIADVSNLQIWNRALTASEVLELYRNPFGMFEREPIELWTPAFAGAADLEIYAYDTE